MNENGVFDPNENEVSTLTSIDGSFSNLHGDIDKPLVAIGGTNAFTGFSNLRMVMEKFLM